MNRDREELELTYEPALGPFRLKGYPATINNRQDVYDFLIFPNKVLYFIAGKQPDRFNRLRHQEFIEILKSSSKNLTLKQIKSIERNHIREFSKLYGR